MSNWISCFRTHGSRCSCTSRYSAVRRTAGGGSGNGGGQNEPTYENLEFHRVKISIPGHNGGRAILLNSAAAAAGDHHYNGCPMGANGMMGRNNIKQPTVNTRVIRHEISLLRRKLTLI